MQMERLVAPTSVAIVGASNKIFKVGGAIARNAINSDYQGKIFLVNPKIETLFGRKVYSNLLEIPESIDLVEIVVPADLVPAIMEQSAQKGVKGVIIVSAGFAEVGVKNFRIG